MVLYPVTCPKAGPGQIYSKFPYSQCKPVQFLINYDLKGSTGCSSAHSYNIKIGRQALLQGFLGRLLTILCALAQVLSGIRCTTGH